MAEFFLIPHKNPYSQSLLMLGKIEEILAKYHPNFLTISPQAKGSMACRLLLQQIFYFALDFQQLSQVFDESGFPYRLTLPSLIDISPDKSVSPTVLQYLKQYSQEKFSLQKFLSFSHSQTHVAVLVSDSTNLGVDIEDKAVSEAVSHRYFLPAEIDWVKNLPLSQQATGRKLLWTLKESLIKAKSRADSQLIAGLKINLLEYLSLEQMRDLIKLDSENNQKQFNFIDTDSYQFGFSPQWQCGYYLGL